MLRLLLPSAILHRVFPNCTGKIKGERKVLVGDEVLEVKDIASLTLRRPVDRGYVVAWDVQKDIWTRYNCTIFQLQFMIT